MRPNRRCRAHVINFPDMGFHLSLVVYANGEIIHMRGTLVRDYERWLGV